MAAALILLRRVTEKGCYPAPAFVTPLLNIPDVVGKIL